MTLSQTQQIFEQVLISTENSLLITVFDCILDYTSSLWGIIGQLLAFPRLIREI